MIEIRPMSMDSKDGKELIEELNQILTEITGDDGTRHFRKSDVEQERSTFLIGYVDQVPYACGALRELDRECGEIKRVYARKNSCGMGQKVVQALEKEAIQLGYQKVVLETRIQNKHAIAFYEKQGYTHCPNYGVYKDSTNAYCCTKNLQESYRIVKTDGTNPDFEKMCQKLDDTLDEMVGTKVQRKKYDKFNQLDSIHDVVIIYMGNEVVGSGAYKKYDDETVEIKRVYVDRSYRGRGIGKMLLQKLEDDAKKQGYRYAVLETGKVLVAAYSMYQRIGYQVISNYGPYKDMKESVCMKKELE